MHKRLYRMYYLKHRSWINSSAKKSTDETASKTSASSQSHCVPDLLVDDLKSSSVTNVSGDVSQS